MDYSVAAMEDGLTGTSPSSSSCSCCPSLGTPSSSSPPHAADADDNASSFESGARGLSCSSSRSSTSRSSSSSSISHADSCRQRQTSPSSFSSWGWGQGQGQGQRRQSSHRKFAGLCLTLVSSLLLPHCEADAGGQITNGIVQPSDFSVGATNQVRLFFQVETSTGVKPSLILTAPPNVDLQPSDDNCQAANLAESYYTGTTKKLPTILECDGEGRREGALATRRKVRLWLDGALIAGNRYAFQLPVTNPPAAYMSADFLTGWFITTYSSSNTEVDTSSSALKFDPAGSSARGWGLYQSKIASSRFSMEVSSYQPYSLSSAWATVTIAPLQVAADVTSTMRILAPAGFEWVLTSARYGAASAGSSGVTGATASLPSGLPTLNTAKTALEWSSASYLSSETYGFACQLKVPDKSPTTSVNAFFVEIGDWTSSDIADRHEALVVAAGTVQALTNVSVDPSSVVVGETISLTMQARLATAIPAAGSLLVVSPSNYPLPSSCSLTTLTVPSTFTSTLTCTVAQGTLTSSAGTTDAIEFKIKSSSGTIPKGYYQFQIATKNPTSTKTNAVSGTTTCGYEQCWSFFSLYGDDTTSLDVKASAAGYAVLAAMGHAALAPLSEKQRISLKQTRRPSQEMGVVVAMELAEAKTSSSELRVQAPPGFLFRTDCLSGTHTSDNEVFASATLWEASVYTSWPSAATISSCVGEDNVATLQVAAGLKAATRYALRLTVTTPATEPSENENVWTLEMGSEASVPFDSFLLSTFKNTALYTASQAQGVWAPVSIVFEPSLEVPGGGILVVKAPTSFSFDLDHDGTCSTLLLLDEVRFTNDKYRCLVDSDFPTYATVELSPGAELLAGSSYRLVLLMKNDASVGDARGWTLQSSKSKSTSVASALDETRITGFPVVSAVPLWHIGLADGFSASGKRGLLDVRLQIWATTPVALSTGDVFLIQGPAGFSFVDSTSGGCNSHEFQTLTGSAPVVGSLQDIALTCDDVPTGFKITYSGSATIAAGARLALLIWTTNPRTSPSSFNNYWHFDHLNSEEEVLAAGFMDGYVIQPQLEDASVALTGSLQAAGSKSTLTVTFRAVTNCTALRIAALLPTGFDFTSASISSASSVTATIVTGSSLPDLSETASDGSSVSSSDDGVITLQASLVEGQLVKLLLKDVVLADTAGSTEWLLETFADSTLVDNRVVSGFRQPGLISVVSSSLQNELDPYFTSGGDRTSDELQLMNSWTPRASQPAVAIFTLRFPSLVSSGESLVISTDSDAVLSSAAANLTVVDPNGQQSSPPFTATITSAGALSLVLGDSIVANSEVTVEFPLTSTASSARGAAGNWRFETQDGGTLPTHTNDALLGRFSLVESLSLDVTATHAPPTGEFAVTLSISLGSARPSLLYLLAPSSFEVTTNCTVSLATTSCYHLSADDDASLFIVPESSLYLSGDLTISVYVTAPALDDASNTWKLSAYSLEDSVTAPSSANIASIIDYQIGWGEDRSGFTLTPITGAVAAYGAIPLATVSVAITFPVTHYGSLQPKALQVYAPENYELSCAASYFRLISMPRNSSVCTTSPLTITLEDESAFPEGTHTFMMGVTVPRTTPTSSSSSVAPYFRIRLLEDADNTALSKVVDAATTIPGHEVQSLLLRLKQPTLSWASSKPDSTTTITLRLTFDRALAAGSSVLAFAAILIELPEDIDHTMTSSSELSNLNSEFPLAEDGVQLDAVGSSSTKFGGSAPTLRKIRLVRDESQAVPAGTHGWVFPIAIPSTMPSANIWYMSLCSDASCTSKDDSSVFTTFAVSGFFLNEVSAVQGYTASSGSSRVWSTSVVESKIWSLLVVLLALPLFAA